MIRIAALALVAGVSGGTFVAAIPTREASPPPEEGSHDPGEDETTRRGGLLYRIHCASCHGEDGTGAGPMSEILTVAPTNLTRLSARQGGGLSEETLRTIIDGRQEVPGHGSREMPVWGMTFRTPGLDVDQEPEVRGRIDDLVAYLASIQGSEKEPTSPGEGRADEDPDGS